jgi:riboflavin kinase/FMN adenylyltransferase
MIIYRNLNIKKNHKNSVIAIGNFDGLHLGHQKVLNQARLKAKKEKLKFGVITFEPIPNMFFNKNIQHHRINFQM